MSTFNENWERLHHQNDTFLFLFSILWSLCFCIVYFYLRRTTLTENQTRDQSMYTSRKLFVHAWYLARVMTFMRATELPSLLVTLTINFTFQCPIVTFTLASLLQRACYLLLVTTRTEFESGTTPDWKPLHLYSPQPAQGCSGLELSLCLCVTSGRSKVATRQFRPKAQDERVELWITRRLVHRRPPHRTAS